MAEGEKPGSNILWAGAAMQQAESPGHCFLEGGHSAKVKRPHRRPQGVDQGTEFVSGDLDIWAHMCGVTLDFSRPGKPTDNAFAEASNSRIRAECTNAHWFLTLADAREKMEAWRKYYNEDRPHGAIGPKPPISLQNAGDAASLSL